MSDNLPPAAGWLVVGTGRHVDRFGLPGLAAAHGATAVALCGSDAAHSAELAARHGVGRWGLSVEELLSDERVTHVYVASRNDDHERHVALAAAAGKHVLCEKPLAGDSIVAQRMVMACARGGIALGTGFHLRHNAAHRAARALIAEGMIGRPLWVDVAYLHQIGHGDSPARLGASRSVDTPSKGAMAGTGAHAIDLAQWFAGSGIDRLNATFTEREDAPAGPQRIVQVSGVTSTGVLVTLAAGRAAFPANGVTVTGETGRLSIARSIGNSGGGRLIVHTADSQRETDFPPHDVYAAQFEDFASATAAGRSPDASGDDGLSALRIAEAVDNALTIPPDPWVTDLDRGPNKPAGSNEGAL